MKTEYCVGPNRVRVIDGRLEVWSNISETGYRFDWSPIEWDWLERKIDSSHTLWTFLQADRAERGMAELECPREALSRARERLEAIDRAKNEHDTKATEEAKNRADIVTASSFGFSDVEEFIRVCRVVRAFTQGSLR